MASPQKLVRDVSYVFLACSTASVFAFTSVWARSRSVVCVHPAAASDMAAVAAAARRNETRDVFMRVHYASGEGRRLHRARVYSTYTLDYIPWWLIDALNDAGSAMHIRRWDDVPSTTESRNTCQT